MGLDQYIVFSSADLAKVILPHNDPLVIHVYFGAKQIRRVLVDDTVDVNILFKDVFDKLGFPPSICTPPDRNLQTFNSVCAPSIGTITLSISVGNEKDGWITHE